MKNARMADEQANEEEEIRQLREPVKIENSSNSSSRFVSLHSKRWRDFVRGEAIWAAEEAEKERKRLQIVEMARMAAEMRELERQRGEEEKARA